LGDHDRLGALRGRTIGLGYPFERNRTPLDLATRRPREIGFIAKPCGCTNPYRQRLGESVKYRGMPGYAPRARRIVYSVADLHHVRLHQAKVEGRPELPAHARLIAARELLAARRVDLVLTHSLVEAELLRRAMNAFIGSRGHSPNPDLVHHLVDRI
jgi:hypothetical protein